MHLKNTSNINLTSIKILLYGPSGAGKTTTASTLEHSKTLIISAESGLLSIRHCNIDVFDLTVNDKNQIIPSHERLDNIGRIYNYLINDTKYENIFIDSLSEISQIVLDSCEKRYPDPKNSLQKWGDSNKLMTSIITKFRDLQKNVIFTCLSKVEKDENNRRFQDFSVYGSISAKLPQYFDEVFFLHSFKNDEGNIVRKIQTQNDNVVLSKDRSSKLDLFEEPNLNMIINKIRQ